MFSATTKESAANTANEAKNTLYNAKRDIQNADIKSDLASVATKAGREVRSYIDAASEQLTDAREKIISEVEANPVRASLIALGAGFVLGVLFRR